MSYPSCILPGFIHSILCRALAISALLQTVLTAPGASAQDPTPMDLDALRLELEMLQNNRATQVDRKLDAAQSALVEAMGGPSQALRLYHDAHRAVNLAGQSNEGGQFNEWRQKNNDLHGQPAFRAALALHVQYLHLAVERARDPDSPNLTALSRYVEELNATRIEHGGSLNKPDPLRDLLTAPAAAGVIAKYLEVTPTIQAVPNWEAKAGNLDGIMETGIRAPLRAQQDPAVIDAWDFQILLAKNRVAANPNELAARNFESNELPNLAWNRAEDQLRLGNVTAAITEMMQIIRSNPQHAKHPDWINRVQTVLDQLPESPENPDTRQNSPEAGAGVD